MYSDKQSKLTSLNRKCTSRTIPSDFCNAVMKVICLKRAVLAYFDEQERVLNGCTADVRYVQGINGEKWSWSYVEYYFLIALRAEAYDSRFLILYSVCFYAKIIYIVKLTDVVLIFALN